MLFYERDTLFDDQDQPISHLLDGLKTSTSNVQEFASEKIMTENFEYYLKRVFFDNTYADFVIEKTQLVGHDQLYTSKNEEILRLAFISFLTLLVRKKVKDRIPQMYNLLVSVLRDSPEIAVWFLNNVSNEEFFQEFFIDCLVIDMKAFVYGLVTQAIETIMRQLKESDSVMDETHAQTEDLLDVPADLSPKDARPKQVSIEPVKNYLLLVLETIRKQKEKEKFLHHLYRIIEDCSRYAPLRLLMSQLQAPEHLMYLMHFPEASLHAKLDGETTAVVYESIFKGYTEHGLPDRKVMSIEDINWEKKGEARSKLDFKVNFSPLVTATCKTLHDKLADHVQTCDSIVKTKIWSLFLSHSNSNEARREVCSLVHDITKDDLNELGEMIKIIEARVISPDVSLLDLKGHLYFVKFMATHIDKDTPGKKVSLN